MISRSFQCKGYTPFAQEFLKSKRGEFDKLHVARSFQDGKPMRYKRHPFIPMFFDFQKKLSSVQFPTWNEISAALLAFNSMCDIHVLSNHRTQSAEFTLSLVHNADNSMARKQKQRTPKLCKRLFSSAQALEAPENFKLRPRETNSKSGSTLVLGPTFLPASLGTNMSGKNRRAT